VPLYFFDTRDGPTFIEDDVGMDLPNLEAATVEAARSLTELGRDVIPGSVRRLLIVEVREGLRPVLETRLTFEAVLLAAA
jgi:hypothetical protein